MSLIVAHHFAVHGGFQFGTDVFSVNHLWVQFLSSGGKIGVNVFVLISGYFLCQSKGISLVKLIRLWLSIFFYSVLFVGLFVGLGPESLQLKPLIRSLFPVTYSAYWFISTYFVLYLLSPFINWFIQTLSQTKYQRLLILLTVMWCLIPTFMISTFQSNSLWWFVYLYLLAGYIRSYVKDGRAYPFLWAAGSLYLLALLATAGCDEVGLKFPLVAKHATFFFAMQRLPTLLISLLLFLGFKNMRLGFSSLINLFAATTLGIYLIHENMFVRPFLWKTVFRNASYAGSNWLIPYSIGVIVLVFTGCACLELIRLHLLEKYYKKYLYPVADYMTQLSQRFFDSKIFRNYL